MHLFVQDNVDVTLVHVVYIQYKIIITPTAGREFEG